MRIFFSVGEPSGDLHASNLIRELRSRHPSCQAVGFGGPKMNAAGCESFFDLTQLGVMFLAGALRHLRLFLRLVAEADKYFQSNQVDAVVLIDYPGFNWWIARKAKQHNIPVFYYGVPQMWAWASWRIKKIQRFVDHVICKLPFEAKWFADRGCRAEYVGHPYFDQLQNQVLNAEFVDEVGSIKHPKVLLLPGSRQIELVRNIESLVASANKIREQVPEASVFVGCLNAQHAEYCESFCQPHNIEVYVDKTQELMTTSDVCLACSGSVSLELLYHRLPTVIVYKISWLKLCLQVFVLKCRYITLTNLMSANDISKASWWPYDPDAVGAEDVAMPEYMSALDRSQQIADRIVGWLQNSAEMENQRQALNRLAVRFAVPGATSRAADYIINVLGQRQNREVAA